MSAKTGTTILGLDPAISRTGVARWRDGRLSTMTIHTNKDHAIEARMRWVCGNIWPLITSRTFVVLEAPYMSQNGATTMKLAGLHYVLRYGLYARGVPFGVMTPSQLKTFATGNGNCGKTTMIEQALAEFGPGADLAMGHWEPPVPSKLDDDANSHEADALHALHAGLYHAWKSDAVPAAVMEPGISHEQGDYLINLAINSGWPELEWEE